MNGFPAVFLGGFGMVATFWLTRSMRDSEPVVGVTPATLPARTAALCAVAIVPFVCGCLALFAFLRFHPVGAQVYGEFGPPTQVAILVGQMSIPTLGGPLLGVAVGRWVRFPGAAVVLFLVIFGWVNLATWPSLTHPDSAAASALRLFSPFAYFVRGQRVDVTTWHGSPWFFLGWQLALCAIAVLVALLRGADGRVRPRVARAFGSPRRSPGSCSCWPTRRGHPHRERVMILPVLRAGAMAGGGTGISGVAVVVGGCGVASPAIAPVMLTIAFTLLAAAAAFALDEPASQVVDVTPTGPIRRTAIRALALLAPLTAGAVLMLAGALRGLALPWAATGLALAGNVVLGFAVACVARTRTGEPGPPASAAVVLILMAPTLLPFVARRVSTFPASDGDGLSSSTVWWTVLAVCVGGRRPVDRRPVPGPPTSRFEVTR